MSGPIQMLRRRLRPYAPQIVKDTVRSSLELSETIFNLSLRLILRRGRVKLHRPCLVLGSSPDPYPVRMDNFDLICVNCSGFVAKELGLPEPKVTLLGSFKLVVPRNEEDRRVLHGLRTEYLVLIKHRLPVSRPLAESLLALLHYHYKQLLTLRLWDRAYMIRKVTGKNLLVSNGIFAACYALHNGAPEIILSGFSLTRDGHYYSDQNRRRGNVSSDLAALIAMKERGWPVKTSEPELAELTGLPLV